jgi:hypothetical protein
MRAGFTACVLTLPAAAGAVEDGCRKFDWPVNREIELFGEGFFADVERESALPMDCALSMLLKPVAQVIYTRAARARAGRWLWRRGRRSGAAAQSSRSPAVLGELLEKVERNGG